MKTFSVFLVASCLSLSGCASLDSLLEPAPESFDKHPVVIPSRISSDILPKNSEKFPVDSSYPVGTAPTPGYEQNELLKKKAEKRKKLEALYRSIQQ